MSETEQLLQQLASLLTLQQKVRRADSTSALGQCLVNETRHIVSYRSALLFHHNQIQQVSGLPEPVRDAPFTQWARRLCQYLQQQEGEKIQPVDVNGLPAEYQEDWAEFFPANCLWLPLKNGAGAVQGYLFLARAEVWNKQELNLLQHLAETAAHALQALELTPKLKLQPKASRRGLIAGAAALVVILLLMLPVNQTALAPAEIVARNNDTITAPLDGVIGEVVVQPNQWVETGDVLLKLDNRALLARLDVAIQALKIAQAEYKRAQQASTGYRQNQTPLPVLQTRIDQSAAEVHYLQSQLQRVEIRSENEGVVILDDPEALEGRPVRVGERLMVVADPASAEIEFWLPVANSMPLPDNAEVELFLNVNPGHALDGTLRNTNYQAQLSPENILAFRGRAELKETEDIPRLGWRGTAKILGNDVPLYYYLFSRPYAAVRQWLGV
ncbi:efflux RND transporter periplasmic adaptor subunit [Spongorhabdus nitratireducens]